MSVKYRVKHKNGTEDSQNHTTCDIFVKYKIHQILGIEIRKIIWKFVKPYIYIYNKKETQGENCFANK